MKIDKYEWAQLEVLARMLGCSRQEAAELAVRTLVDVLQPADPNPVLLRSMQALVQEARTVKREARALVMSEVEAARDERMKKRMARARAAAKPKRLQHQPFADLLDDAERD